MLTVICPSRGRPKAAAEVLETFKATAVDLDSRLWLVVDRDDSTWRDYPTGLDEPVGVSYRLGEQPPMSGMMPALNMAIRIPEIIGDSDVVGFIGDDHRFRTTGWDAAIEDFLDIHPGIAFADDMARGGTLPTQWFISRKIVDVFGMGPSFLRHLFIDDYWKTLGSAAHCLFYMPDIKIEHMHPTVGKGEWDDSYRESNSTERYTEDGAAYWRWHQMELERDTERLRAIVG